MATIVNNAARVISLNGGEHNGHDPGGVTLLPASAPVEISDDLVEILRKDRSFLALVANGSIGDLENTFGVAKLPARVLKKSPDLAPKLPESPSMPSTAKAITPPAPTVAPVEDAPAAETDPFEGFSQAITPEDLAKLPTDLAIPHVVASDNIDTLKAFWFADARPEVREAITKRAQTLKTTPASAP